MSEKTTKSKVWKVLSELSSQKNVTEIIINSSDRIFIEKEGKFFFINASITVQDIKQFCQDVAQVNGKRLDASSPILDGSLADGSRINIILDPYAGKCPAVTIRKFLKQIQKFDDNPDVFDLGFKWVEFLKTLIKARCNFVISGGTGVGKTTFMNLLLAEVSQSERVITIEDTRELSASLPNIVSLEASAGNSVEGSVLTIRDLVKNALRMRPDRIIVGETRGPEVFDLLQAMNTGHDGSFTSIHSNNPADCLKRIETLYLLLGVEAPLSAIREQICSAVDFIIQIKRDRDGHRYVDSLVEVVRVEQNTFLLQDVLIHDETGLHHQGLVPKCIQKLVDAGLPRDYFA